MASGGNIASIRDAKPQRAPDLRRREDGSSNSDWQVLLPECPVTPLGIQGLKLWVLDASDQLVCFATDCRKGDLVLLFGGDEYLTKLFPRYAKPVKGVPPEIIGFDQSDAQTALIMACQRKGIFNPAGRVFGRGAHRAGADGEELVLHMGRRVLIAGPADKKGKPGPLTEHRAGLVGDNIFPALQALPSPAPEPSTQAEGQALFDLFKQWYWVEAEPAPLLLLGMCAQMHICGALDWRSHVWLAGPTSAGKSALQKLMRAIHAEWCLHTEDASEAAVRQVLNDDTLPVMIDEAEVDDNPARQQAIINLMKKASSGAKMHRGSADHQAKEFTAQSCFLLSSVLHGLVKGEERNRVAILDMRQVPVMVTKEWETPDLPYWRETGRKMHRRMIEQWPRFAQTLADYKREIWSHGFEGRWQDTFGTLLACADCLLFDCAPSRESELNDSFGHHKAWVLSILPMMLRSKHEARSDIDRCIAHLMSQLIPGGHGAPPETVGQWVKRAMDLADPEQGGINETARARLKQYGLRLVCLKKDDKDGYLHNLDGEPIPNDWDNGFLAVSYPTSTPLASLFVRSDWANGAWLQSLGKVAGAVKGLKVRFSGPNPDNAIAVPLKALRGEEG